MISISQMALPSNALIQSSEEVDGSPEARPFKNSSLRARLIPLPKRVNILVIEENLSAKYMR
jgi:hypothetical protein